MTFHKSKRDQFITSGRRLVDETINSFTEYFELLYNIIKSNGKLKLQLEQRDRKKSDSQRGPAKSRYEDRRRYMTDERRTSRSCVYHDDHNHDRGYKLSRNSGHKRDKPEWKAPLEFSGKPCHIHGNKAKHTYVECGDNPKNFKSSSGNRNNNNNRKCSHDAHYHDKHYLSSNDESPDDHRTPEPSDDGMKSSASSGNSNATKKSTMLILVKYLKRKRKVRVVQRSASRQKNFWNKKPSHSAKHVTLSLLQDELEVDKSPMEIEKNLMTSRIRSYSTNDAPCRWNLGKLYQSQV